MGYKCPIRDCKVKYVKGGTHRFFKFPKDETIANKWLQVCKPRTNAKTSKVCSVHFKAADYSLRHILMNDSLIKGRIIKPDAVPSIHISEDTIEDIPSNCSEKDTEKSVDNIPEQKQPLTNIDNILETSSTARNIDQESSSETNISELANVLEPVCSVLEIQREKSTEMITIPASEYKTLIQIQSKYDVMLKKMQQIFTPGQVRSLTKPVENRRVKWTPEDIAAAVNFRNVSPKGYEYMRDIGLPLPGIATLYKWTKHCEDVDSDEGSCVQGHTSSVPI